MLTMSQLTVPYPCLSSLVAYKARKSSHTLLCRGGTWGGCHSSTDLDCAADVVRSRGTMRFPTTSREYRRTTNLIQLNFGSP